MGSLRFMLENQKKSALLTSRIMLSSTFATRGAARGTRLGCRWGRGMTTGSLSGCCEGPSGRCEGTQVAPGPDQPEARSGPGPEPPSSGSVATPPGVVWSGLVWSGLARPAWSGLAWSAAAAFGKVQRKSGTTNLHEIVDNFGATRPISLPFWSI
jgi:hypothetical protein